MSVKTCVVFPSNSNQGSDYIAIYFSLISGLKERLENIKCAFGKELSPSKSYV